MNQDLLAVSKAWCKDNKDSILKSVFEDEPDLFYPYDDEMKRAAEPYIACQVIFDTIDSYVMDARIKEVDVNPDDLPRIFKQFQEDTGHASSSLKEQLDNLDANFVTYLEDNDITLSDILENENEDFTFNFRDGYPNTFRIFDKGDYSRCANFPTPDTNIREYARYRNPEATNIDVLPDITFGDVFNSMKNSIYDIYYCKGDGDELFQMLETKPFEKTEDGDIFYQVAFVYTAEVYGVSQFDLRDAVTGRYDGDFSKGIVDEMEECANKQQKREAAFAELETMSENIEEASLQQDVLSL